MELWQIKVFLYIFLLILGWLNPLVVVTGVATQYWFTKDGQRFLNYIGFTKEGISSGTLASSLYSLCARYNVGLGVLATLQSIGQKGRIKLKGRLISAAVASCTALLVQFMLGFIVRY
ncbi:uncharacterized protein LOC131929073 [Physella acuta]|uniref:uncharacterized protein LOC131929073 n=1 Tax=Physella acuta TaxID=109671 RepID=UPI0027DBB6A5|nr:uncharacterized protein LOC131929073 [Physella acuta]